MQALNTENWIPKYEQVKNLIREKIISGVYPVGSIIPSENQLPKMLGMSKQTIIKAVGNLVSEGILRREQGKGTFVNSFPTDARNVGIILSAETPGSFFTSIIQSATTELDALNCSQTIKFSSSSHIKEKKCIEELIRQKVDGILLTISHPGHSRENVEFLLRQKVPFVLIDKYIPGLETDYVIADDYKIGFIATEHLIKLGHEKIAFVAKREKDFSSTNGRLAGYRDALIKNKLDPDTYIMTAREEWGDFENAGKFFNKRNRPTALITQYFIQTENVLRKLGLRIPQDMSFVALGSYDSNFSSYTKVDFFVPRILQESVRILSEQINNKQTFDKTPKQQIKIKPSLLLGNSTAHL